MSLTTVLFDIGDTLWHSGGAPAPAEFRRIAAERADDFLSRYGTPVADPSLIARTAWDAMESAAARSRATTLEEPDYAEVARAALAGVGLHLDADVALGLLEHIYVSGPEGGKIAYPDARATLEALRARGFKLGIVTNRSFGGTRFRDDLAAAGLDIDWDTISVSVEVGYLKPHPRLFESALEALGVTPAKAMVVGNSLREDVAGAQALGMLAAWKISRADAEGVTPDFSFDQVSELLALPVLQEARP